MRLMTHAVFATAALLLCATTGAAAFDATGTFAAHYPTKDCMDTVKVGCPPCAGFAPGR